MLAISLGLLGFGIVAACSVPEREIDSGQQGACIEGCASQDASTDTAQESATLTPDAMGEAAGRNSQCGKLDECDPDQARAVSSCLGQETKGAGGAGTIISAQPATPQAPSAGGIPIGKIPGGDALEDAGSGDDGASQEEPSGGASPPSAGAPASGQIACHVKQGESGPLAYCVKTGNALDGEVCKVSTDCAPGLACVRDTQKQPDGTVGRCRLYCCAGSSSCAPGLFCKSRKRNEAVSNKDVVPVCIPSDNCELLKPGECAPGEACVVAPGGVTTCDVPGANEVGQACPCAEGLVCIQSLNMCRQLCHLGTTGECGNGKCVGGSAAYPVGFGVCLSDDD